ncbi:dethiobiotin synthase [Psychrobacter aestuarii]|uniref:ATP-dependent dethiobiotin synthetase BioD n=1 Tax=Psychrobacter aestuarii TaxID=556327 RepID=A0ABP3FAK7_9GAMM|nr:dethiobiotin synthase [Psychrobacter aestuarii]
MRVLFISGIDTEIGKTYATGMLARALQDQGVKVITQKLIQTGVEQAAIAEDILTHRQLMGIEVQPCDTDHTTCPYRYTKPASPHLAAALSGQTPDMRLVSEATDKLAKDYEVILLEGAGGLLVPITEDLLSLDYIAEQGYPVVLVTSGRLGSINHTLLSLEAIKQRGLVVHSVIYNHIHDDDAQIAASSIDYLQHYLKTHYPSTHWLALSADKAQSPDSAASEYLLPALPQDFLSR